MKRHATPLTLCLLVIALAACGDSRPPVAELTVEPAEIELSYPGFTPVTFEWAALRDLDGEPRVFVHLLDELGGLARTFDHAAPADWSVGGTASYEIELYQSALAPPLAAGSYHLVAGLYDSQGKRWPLRGSEDPEDKLAYRVARVRVSEAGDGLPMFFFSAGWQPVEGGTDRQVLGRRWLGESGSLRVAEIRRPGAVLLLVGIPTGESKVEDLVLAEGASGEQSVRIASSCGDFEATISGAGSHRVVVPVGAGEDGAAPAECEISFESNYYVISLETLERRTIALENLAWNG